MASKLINNKFKKTFDQKKEKFGRLPQKRFYIIAFFVNLVIIGISFLSRFILPPQIPLFYGFPQNQQQLSPSYLLFLPALVSLAITVINAYLSIFVDNNYLKKVLAITPLLITLLSSITILKIIFLVGSI